MIDFERTVVMNKKALLSLFLTAALCLCSCGSSANDVSSADSSSDAAESSTQSEYTLEADFSKGASPDFYISAGWSNGAPFNCMWSDNNVTFNDGKMQLIIDSIADGDSYRGGEYRTKENYGYGLYEVSMKAIKNDGVVSSFFTYTGPSENNPWDEIDVEILGKDTTKVQFNYYTDGVGGHEYMYDLGFDASEDFHTYGFEWTKDKITWYVDGKEAYSATEDLPVTPGKVMMNAWNGIGVDGWLKAFDGTVPLTAEYQWARFTAAE